MSAASRNRARRSSLRAAALALPSGVELEVYDGLRDLPHYDADLDVEPHPAAVTELRDAIAEAYAAGHLGKDIHGSGYDLDVVVHAGAGAAGGDRA